MTKMKALKKYFVSTLVEFSKAQELDNGTWHF